MPYELSPNLEDYLETIFLLESEQKSARAKDIAENLKVQRASVTGALQSLAQKGLIHYQPYSSVTLTPEGFRLGSKIVHRHKVLYNFLSHFLQLPEEVAEANACRMEHFIDDQTLERLIKFAKFVQKCPRTGEDWLEAFTRFCSEHGQCQNCLSCIKNCLNTFESQS
jgi:DtxR family Mn-dependent transcriptional regulator